MTSEMLTEATGDFEYQKPAEAYVRDHDEAALIMGYSTGKTRVALTRVIRDSRITTVIYFTRKNNIKTTGREIRKHCVSELYEAAGGTARIRKIVGHISSSFRSPRITLIILTNYDSAKTCYNELAALQPHAILVDESTAIKRNSKRTQAIRKLAKLPSVIFRCVMTGEMAPQKKEDYYFQFDTIKDRNPLGATYWSFQRSFFNKMGYDLILKPGARQRLLQVVSENSFIMKTDDVRIPIRVSNRMLQAKLSNEQKHWIAMLTNGCVIMPNNSAWMITNPAVGFMKKLQICSGFINIPAEQGGGTYWLNKNPKLDSLIECISAEMTDHLSPSGPKITIWARFNNEIDSILDALKKLKVGVVSLRGSNTAKRNDAGMLNMLNNPETRICVAQADMGFGLNELVTCDTAIWYSNSPIVESRMQAEMRFDRPGQKYRLLNHIDVVMEDAEDEAVALAVGQARMDCRGFTSKAQILQRIKRDKQKTS